MSRIHPVSEQWRRIARDLNLSVEAPFKVNVGRGVTLRTRALVRGFGARVGMLIVDDHRLVLPYDRELTKLGFGWSEASLPDEHDLAEVRGWLADWGWTGPRDQRPDWL